MTTIACDGKEIAADGLVTGNGLVHMTDVPKVRRLVSGAVVGMSGSAFHMPQAVEFLEGKRDSIEFGVQFEAIILHRGGRCECMDGNGRRYEQTVPCVTGSGSPIALGAMAAGATAAEAVAIACRLDTCTGGMVTAMAPE